MIADGPCGIVGIFIAGCLGEPIPCLCDDEFRKNWSDCRGSRQKRQAYDDPEGGLPALDALEEAIGASCSGWDDEENLVNDQAPVDTRVDTLDTLPQADGTFVPAPEVDPELASAPIPATDLEPVPSSGVEGVPGPVPEPALEPVSEVAPEVAPEAAPALAPEGVPFPTSEVVPSPGSAEQAAIPAFEPNLEVITSAYPTAFEDVTSYTVPVVEPTIVEGVATFFSEGHPFALTANTTASDPVSKTTTQSAEETGSKREDKDDKNKKASGKKFNDKKDNDKNDKDGKTDNKKDDEDDKKDDKEGNGDENIAPGTWVSRQALTAFALLAAAVMFTL